MPQLFSAHYHLHIEPLLPPLPDQLLNRIVVSDAAGNVKWSHSQAVPPLDAMRQILVRNVGIVEEDVKNLVVLLLVKLGRQVEAGVTLPVNVCDPKLVTLYLVFSIYFVLNATSALFRSYKIYRLL